MRLLPRRGRTRRICWRPTAIVFATPENLAAIAGLMKDFFDRSYYPALDRINGRPYATMICAGSDGRTPRARSSASPPAGACAPIADPLIVCTHAQTPEAILAPKMIDRADRARCAELGAAFAAGLAAGIF